MSPSAQWVMRRTFPHLDLAALRRFEVRSGGRTHEVRALDDVDAVRDAQSDGPITYLVEV